MARLLINLRGVPDDEADEIRALLAQRRIEFYETAPSFWGVSGGGIWIRRRDDVAEAERALAEYQARRRDRARAEYAARYGDGPLSLWGALREHPLRMIALLVVVAFLVAILALPFVLLFD